MTEMTSISVDIDVHKAIEGRRKSFGQSPNQILRDVFNLDTPPAMPKEKPSRASGSGSYTIVVGGKSITEPSMKLAYKKAILALAATDRTFLQRLSLEETPARRIVATEPQNLYKASPGLVTYAERLDEKWWIDLNLSSQQASSRLAIACKVANLKFGSDLRIEF